MADSEIKVTAKVQLDQDSARQAGQQAASAVSQGMNTGSAPAAYGAGAGLASGTKGLPATSIERSLSASDRSRKLASDERRGRMQAEAERKWEKEQAVELALKNRAARILQGQMGIIPPKLSAIPKPAAGSGGGISLPPGMSALAASGIPYLSTIMRAVFSPWGAAAAVAGIALMQLRKAVQATTEAFENARRLYARQLQSGGMPGGFVGMRGSLARIIGVGEQEVYQYGRAVEYLSSRLANANRIQVQVNRNLTSTAWEFDVLKENSKALFAVIANEAAPAMRLLAAGLSEVTKSATSWLQSNTGKAAMIGTKMAMLGGSGVWGQIASKLMALGATTGAKEAPPVEAWSKRMPSSAWERMGMVMGVGVGGNPAQETARNTKRSAELLNQILHGIARQGGDLAPSSPMPQP